MSNPKDDLEMPSFLKRPTLTPEQKAMMEREDKEGAARWYMPGHDSTPQGDNSMQGNENTTEGKPDAAVPASTEEQPKAKRTRKAKAPEQPEGSAEPEAPAKRTRKPKTPAAPPVEISVKFRDVMQELGVDVTSRAGKTMALAVADDAEKSRVLLAKFAGIDPEPLTVDEAKAQAEATIRAELQLPTVTAAHEGDQTMAKATKKVAQRAASKGTKAPKAAKAAKDKAPKAKAAGKPREGAVGICAEILRLVSRAKGATTQECLAALVEKFPKRDKAQMHNTVRGELQNIPRRMKGKMKKEKVDGRKGKVYYWTPKD